MKMILLALAVLTFLAGAVVGFHEARPPSPPRWKPPVEHFGQDEGRLGYPGPGRKMT